MTNQQTRAPRRVAVVLAAAALTIAACSSGTPSSQQASGPLKIGMSLPMTGPVADVTKSGLQGYQLWAADVNSAGGLLGRQVSLDVLDNGFDPTQTGAQYTRLISKDKVDLLLGTFSSLLNAPASAIAARQGYLYVEPSGGSASLFTRGFSNLFFAQPGTTDHLPDRFVEWLSGLPSSQRPSSAAYLTQDDPSASPAIAIFKTKLEALGIKSVYNQTYDPSTTNFDAIASSIAHAKPDIVFQGAVADDGAQFVRSLEKISFSPKLMFQTNAPTDETYPTAIGKQNAEAIFTAEAWSPKAKYAGNAAFVAAYTKKYGAPPTEDAANSYTAGQVLAAAVRAVGKVDQKAMASWLHSHTVQTIVGPLKWDSTGVPEGSLLLAQWQSGQLEIIAPASAATTSDALITKPGWRS
ncbi:amino acid ABC transporter substrate-binding protein [Jatrophihabitans telluris]|uniref:Amino acid ABC transporter substrate-binding protein n=1 Tax=Jatrophihabitans telluris TaxID=2038343 RepID=A0ABY4QT82_9ACTN|nr:amino acid ABC transporter substrate-binding protein [Jatrophihabitans telluris]UQX86951.1 amino acid ABC transporter substrate-binding protein [Jatrophihabitans telluris]